MVSRAGWIVACAALAILFQSFLHQPVTAAASVAVLLLTAMAVWRPFVGLLLLAGFGPLGGVLMAVGRGNAGAIVLAEVLTLAFLTGWTARQAFTAEPLKVNRAVAGSAVVMAVAAFASALVHSARAAVEMQTEPATFLLWQTIREYVLHLPGSEPVVAAVALAAGTLLVIAAAHLTAGNAQRRTAVLRMIVCGGAAAAALNVVRLVEIAARREDALAAFLDLVATERVNTQYGDLNAAGSFFVLGLLLSMAVSKEARWLTACTAPLLAAGLWISGSRFALAAVLVSIAAVMAAGVIGAGPRRVKTALASFIALVVVAGAVWTWYPAGRNTAVREALGIRLDLARAGVQMARENPVFGVGLGRYYVLSERYAGEALRTLGFARENAHNNFIQIAAELGIPGFIALLVLIGAAFRELARSPSTRETHWLAAGLLAFLLTCIGGHPLLVAQAAMPFWIALGLAAAPASPLPASSSPWRYAPAVLAVLLLASIWPRGVDAARSANLEHVSVGLSRWQRAPDGTRYRWMGGRGTFFVVSSASAVRIPVKAGSSLAMPAELTLVLDGREANRFLISPEESDWRDVLVVMPPAASASYRRVDLVIGPPGGMPFPREATDESGLLMVGRPVIVQLEGF